MPRNIFQNYLSDEDKKMYEDELLNRTKNIIHSGRNAKDMLKGYTDTGDTSSDTGNTPPATDGTNGTQSGLDGYLQAYERYSQLARDNTQRQLDYGLARIEKYLPNYLKSQGLSGQGVAETTYINALNNYNTAAREAEADQLASAMEMAKYKSDVEREQARYDYEDKKATENEKYVRGLEEYQTALNFIPSAITEDTTEADVDKLLEAYTFMTDAQKDFIKKYAVTAMPEGKWADEEDVEVGTGKTVTSTNGAKILGSEANVVADPRYFDVDFSKSLEDQGWEKKYIYGGGKRKNKVLVGYKSPDGRIISMSDLNQLQEDYNKLGVPDREGRTVEFKESGRTKTGTVGKKASENIAYAVKSAISENNGNGTIVLYDGKYYVKTADGIIRELNVA